MFPASLMLHAAVPTHLKLFAEQLELLSLAHQQTAGAAAAAGPNHQQQQCVAQHFDEASCPAQLDAAAAAAAAVAAAAAGLETQHCHQLELQQLLLLLHLHLHPTLLLLLLGAAAADEACPAVLHELPAAPLAAVQRELLGPLGACG
jgi:hypothetical protein